MSVFNKSIILGVLVGIVACRPEPPPKVCEAHPPARPVLVEDWGQIIELDDESTGMMIAYMREVFDEDFDLKNYVICSIQEEGDRCHIIEGNVASSRKDLNETNSAQLRDFLAALKPPASNAAYTLGCRLDLEKCRALSYAWIPSDEIPNNTKIIAGNMQEPLK